LRPDKLWPCAKPDTADKNGIPEAVLCFGDFFMMASQKLTNCCVAAIALVTAAYLSTPHSSTIARLAFGAFCLAIRSFCFLAKAAFMDQVMNSMCPM
jgi:hypothetical protein